MPSAERDRSQGPAARSLVAYGIVAAAALVLLPSLFVIDADERLHVTRQRLAVLEAVVLDVARSTGDLPHPAFWDQFVRARPAGVPGSWRRVMGEAGTPQDGWGRPIRYRLRDPDVAELRSAGADGTYETQDDLVLAIRRPPSAPGS